MFKKLISAAIFVISLAVASNGFCADLKIGYVNMRKTFWQSSNWSDLNLYLISKIKLIIIIIKKIQMILLTILNNHKIQILFC